MLNKIIIKAKKYWLLLIPISMIIVIALSIYRGYPLQYEYIFLSVMMLIVLTYTYKSRNKTKKQ